MSLDSFIKSTSKIAKENVEAEQICSTLYVYGSELGTLRIFAYYNSNGAIHNKKVRVGYSKNLNKFYVSIDM